MKFKISFFKLFQQIQNSCSQRIHCLYKGTKWICQSWNLLCRQMLWTCLLCTSMNLAKDHSVGKQIFYAWNTAIPQLAKCLVSRKQETSKMPANEIRVADHPNNAHYVMWCSQHSTRPDFWRSYKYSSWTRSTVISNTTLNNTQNLHIAVSSSCGGLENYKTKYRITVLQTHLQTTVLKKTPTNLY